LSEKQEEQSRSQTMGEETSTRRHVNELPTPAFLVYKDIVQRNTERMKERAKNFGLRLRPHVKTHKTRQGALLQTVEEQRRVVVSTIAEAEYLAPIIKDILYAVPIVSYDKLKRIVHLMSTHNCLIHIEVDSLEGLNIVKQFVPELKLQESLSVFVNLNCGGNREGCDIHSSEAVELVKQVIQSKGLVFAGLYTHGGQSYGLTDESDKRKVAESEAAAVHNFAHRLREEFNIVCPVVSLGSTPTCSLLLSWDHLREKYPLVNEIHPGNYIFYDFMMAQMGNCEESDIAVTVLTTVIAKNKERKTLLVDAGALALSKDLGVKNATTGEFGYGAIKGHSNMVLKSLTQEMGVVQCVDDDSFEKFKLGDKLEIYPNHSCLTAALYSEYQVVDEGANIIETWEPCRGW